MLDFKSLSLMIFPQNYDIDGLFCRGLGSTDKWFR